MIQLFPKDPYYKPLLHFADLNEDGKQDLLAGNGRREEIQILLGALGQLRKLDPELFAGIPAVR